MYRPKVVIFWGKPTGPIDNEGPHPYARIGKKKPVYDQLLLELSKKSDVYVAIGYKNYPKPLFFSEAYQFLGKDKFVKVTGGITADVVYDRSAKMEFPGETDIENLRVLNSAAFKKFSNSKWEFYKKFPDYCPKTQFAETSNDYHQLLSNLSDSEIYVVKPFNGLKGKGIMFGNPAELKDYPFEKPVVVQEFKETAVGIPGLVTGRHDLRVAIVDGKIVWATIRQPQKDSLLANVAQGGTITEIEINSLPDTILPIIKDISANFKKEFNNPLFAIDFGFCEGVPFIYEINDQIGFPLPEMTKNTLVKSLAQLLIDKSR